MKFIFGDFESFYSKTYSLRLMTPAEYILGPEWETICCAVAENRDNPFILPGDEVADYLRGQTEPYAFVSHNALFDASILSFRYDIHPTLCIDTMTMCNALIRYKLPGGRVSLSNVSDFLSIGEKSSTALPAVMGMHKEEIMTQPDKWLAFVAYNLQDVMLCRKIYYMLVKDFPAEQHLIQDMVIKMVTQPSFVADMAKLQAHLNQVIWAKEQLLSRVGFAKEDLLSNDKFAEALRSLGVEPPTKISQVTGKVAWAMAKTDEAFTDLQEHENLEVQALMAARLGIKSTLEETRTRRLISMADACGGWLPVPLKYAGAHTHRFSGDWKVNLQNLPSRKSQALKEGLAAPEGHIVLEADASQIEAKLTAWLAGDWDFVALFEAGADVYSHEASEYYHVEVSKKVNPIMRQIFKVIILACGFGMGEDKLYETLRIASVNEKFDMPSVSDVKSFHQFYRRKHRAIVQLWYWLDSMIARIADGSCVGETLGPIVFEHGAVLLPTGMRLFYKDLKYANGQWTFWYGAKRKPLWGGTLCENIVQALDMVIVTQAAVRIKQRAKREFGIDAHLAHQVHDSLLYLPTLANLLTLKSLALQELSRRPAWGSDLPLSAEAKTGLNYGNLT